MFIGRHSAGLMNKKWGRLCRSDAYARGRSASKWRTVAPRQCSIALVIHLYPYHIQRVQHIEPKFMCTRLEAPPHFSQFVRQYMNHKFPNRWIGRGGAQNWPPRSPDLNPLHYHVWGYVKAVAWHTRWTRENYFSEFSALQEASVTLQGFVGLQVLWQHESDNASKQTEDTSNNLLECWTAYL